MENNQLILKEEWVENNVAKAYPCGWSDAAINGGNKEMHGYPKMATKYGENNNKAYNFTNAQLQRTGNVLRFLSPLSDMKVQDGDGQGTTSHKASCIQTWLFSDGTAASERVLDNFGLYGFDGLAVYHNGEVISFTAGEVIGDTMYAHIEKALSEYRGLYQ